MFSMALAAPKRMKGVTKGKINPDNLEELEEYGFEFALAGIQAIRDKSRKLKKDAARSQRSAELIAEPQAPAL